MAAGFLTESLFGGPTVSTTTSCNNSGGDRKGGGASELIKNKLKASSQLLGKLADKALAALPGTIGSILSWILNRAKEVVGWLSQNLWAFNNMCWSFDIHVFYDENEKEINHLNIHHTVKIAVIPNIKAAFSSSQVISFISGLVFIILIPGGGGTQAFLWQGCSSENKFQLPKKIECPKIQTQKNRMTQDEMEVKVWINMKSYYDFVFQYCVLHSKDSSVWYKNWKTQKNSGNFAKPRKIA